MKHYIIVFLFCVSCSEGFSQNVSEAINNRIASAVSSGNLSDLTFSDFIYKYKSDSAILSEIYSTFMKNIHKSEALDLKLIADMHTIYSQTSSNALKKKVILFNVSVVNDSLVTPTNRDYAGTFLSQVKLILFDNEMKKEISKNLRDTKLVNGHMVLLTGALSMKNEATRLRAIIDSNWNNTGSYAKLSLCRMGDKAALKNYFDSIRLKPLKDAINENWAEIEYIKQPESIDWLVKILFSDKTVPPVKETMEPEKIAYYAINALARNIINFPASIKEPYETESNLKLMREWVRKNRNNIRINKNVW
jgi:hypothetical protein